MVPLILILLVPYMTADVASAARQLAQAVAAAVSHEPVTLTVKNRSGLPASVAAEVRGAFETEVKTGGPAAADVQVTISENLTEVILAAEIRKGGVRQVLMESCPRAPRSPAASGAPQVTLQKKLLWEQQQPILDAVESSGGVLILGAARVLLARGDDRQSAAISPAGAWPRDLRGHLTAGDATFTAYLPGTICKGTTEPQLTMHCTDSEGGWLIAPSTLATFAAGRNFFSGHIDIEPGGTHQLPPFYSAAQAGEGWILAAADGRTLIYNTAWEAAGTIDGWGSDLAAVRTPCGTHILATRRGGAGEADVIEPYVMADHAASTDGMPVEFSGPVRALWSTGNAATAISRDPQTGRYAAYNLSVACGS